MNFLLRSTSVAALAIASAACSTPAPVALKDGDVPAAFTAPAAADATAWPALDWWTNLNAPELPALETAARDQNLDLIAATARVVQAQAQTNIANSALFPSINATGSAQRSGSDRTGVPGGNTHNTFGASAQASYEVDLWGLNRDQLHAAEQSELAARYSKQTVALTITSDVANTYFDVLALRQRITIANQNVDAAKRILAITEAKVTNGVSSNLELAQQRALLAGVEASIPTLVEQEREARYALAILLGRPPEGFDVKSVNLDGIVAPAVQPGIPSSVLERRPDIAQAEAELLSQHANVDAARAAFLPQISLSGSIGAAFNPTSMIWSIGASLLQAVFDAGKLSAESDLEKARQTELLADYRKAVFSAFSDVETSLGQVSSLADRERLTNEQEVNAAEAYRIAELQYREGVTDLLNVLQTQQTLFSAQDQLVQIRLARLQAGIGLYRALGGGWTVATDPNAAPSVGFSPL
jgi:NodT family efflux transporter outer membrane factor (OMF) lipoprotein